MRWYDLTLEFILKTSKHELALWLVDNKELEAFQATMEAIRIKAEAGTEWYAQGKPDLA